VAFGGFGTRSSRMTFSNIFILCHECHEMSRFVIFGAFVACPSNLSITNSTPNGLMPYLRE
jgi:hypothetical protein